MRAHGSSLLAAGITSCEGDFAAGSTVRVLTEAGQEIARGTVNYDACVLRQLIGRQTSEFPALLAGQDIHEEVIHRDNMVLMV
jgi:glutamate 5-kinase